MRVKAENRMLTERNSLIINQIIPFSKSLGAIKIKRLYLLFCTNSIFLKFINCMTSILEYFVFLPIESCRAFSLTGCEAETYKKLKAFV